jgi:RND superfamily putative drug exporter
MRKRLIALAGAVLGLGVPIVVAWLSRRGPRPWAVDVPPPPGVQPPPGVPPPGEPVPASPPRAAAASRVPRPAGPVDGHVLDPHPTGVFAAIGRFDYRFRRWLPLVGLALVIGLNAWSQAAGGRLIQGGWVIPESEEQRAVERLADRFGEQESTMLVLFRAPDGDATDAGFQDEVRRSLEPIAGDPAVDRVETWGETGYDALLSTDRGSTLAIVYLDQDVESSVEDSARLADRLEAPAGVEMSVTGVAQLYHELNERVESDLLRAELISLPLALVILLAVFGTLVAAGLPLLIVALAMPSTFAAISLLSSVVDMSIYVNNVATMIGLALAIDYSLFMVSRFREELRHHSVEIAVERMMGSVGKAVAISGIAVAIGLSSLTVFEAASLRSMGLGGIVSVLSTLVFGLTVLPALLALLGPRVNRLRLPMPRALHLVDTDSEGDERRQGQGVWAWIAARVMRRPVLIAVPVLAFLLALGSPFLSIELSTGQNLEDIPPTPARTAFETLLEDFPAAESDPITAAVTWPEDLGGSLSASRQAALAEYLDSVTALDGVTGGESVLTPPAGMDPAQYRALLALPPDGRPAEAAGLGEWIEAQLAGDTARVRFFTDLLPDSEEGRALVGDIRDVPPPAEASVLTGGLPSRSADFMASFYGSVPVAILIVVAVTGAVLFLTFGSVFLPMKAVLMSLISITASFGALVWIFQQGHLAGPLGFEPSGTIAAWLPIIMFAILFGLSMDYEVLLLSRIRERYLAHGDNTRAVAEGIGLTGGIITGAALIMVAVFSAFALSSIVFIKALGFSMALAVLIDATVVRGIIVPAFMRVMGWVNWWAPRWLQRAVARLGLYEWPDSTDARAAPRAAGRSPEPA